jgi:type I restriction enzyme, S subunit
MSWKTTTIGEHCTVTSSKRFHISERSNTGIPFFCSKEIIQKVNGETITECDYIREEAYEDVKKQFGAPEPGDLLITTRGTYGVPYIYKDTDHFYFADGNLTWLKNFTDDLLPQYLYYWVKSYEGQKKIDAIAIGTAQKAVPIASIKMLELSLPPLNTQKAIVTALSAYDDLIENNRRQIKLLEEAAQRLYKEWFVDLRFPGWETTPIVDGLPEGWSMQTVEELSCVLRRGISPRYNEKAKYMVINQKCIRQAVMDMSEARHQEKAYPDELNLQDGDVVICSTGTGTLGRVGQVYGNYANTTFDSHVTLVRAATDTGTQFLYHAIESNQAYLMGCGKGSTNQQELNKDVIKAVKLLVPTDKLLSTFENQAQAIHDKIRNLRDQTLLATEARDRLLPKLMSGEIEL